MVLAVLLTALPIGCGSKATLHMIPLGTKRLKTSGPLMVRVKPRQCYYWLSDEGKLCIAMSYTKKSILGKMFGKEFYFSLVLDELPAGSARTYRVDRRTGRLRYRSGLSHIRSASLKGLVTIWDYGKKELKGRLRFSVKQQSYFVLTGWSGNAQVLLVGEFKAVPGRGAGEAILARTEEDTMARSLVPLRGRPYRVGGPPRPPQTDQKKQATPAGKP